MISGWSKPAGGPSFFLLRQNFKSNGKDRNHGGVRRRMVNKHTTSFHLENTIRKNSSASPNYRTKGLGSGLDFED